MSSQAHAKPSDVKRIVFKEVVEGDFRKIGAKSNDSDSGGGARDLRFRPYDKFQAIFRRLFPGVRPERRRRNNQNVDVDILVGALHWTDADGDHEQEALFEPPTDSRPGEGRLTRVNTFPPLSKFPSAIDGRVVVLLVQREDGSVWPEFATEKALPNWHDSVSGPILRSLDAKRPKNQVARGFLDFETGEDYSDA